MEAKLKSGKIIKGRLAKTFVSRGLATKTKAKKAEQVEKSENNKQVKDVKNEEKQPVKRKTTKK